MDLPPLGEVVPLPRIREICLAAGLEVLWAKIDEDTPSQEFRCDGCTYWPDRWPCGDIYPACFLHDLKYWAGRPGERAERKAADLALRKAVEGIVGTRVMPWVMYLGVRLGGGWPYKGRFSWGFGRRA